MFDPPILHSMVQDFFRRLALEGYEGECSDRYDDRLLNATDNSIYQVMPQAVLWPRTQRDLSRIMTLAQMPEFLGLKFMPRGGGTGTNGQSLNDCVVIDTSRHLNRILEINEVEGWVRVEPGVVLDQLNAVLKPQGLFLPVEISPGKSATIGGMVSTDACGRGSRVYGKSGDYILDMTCLKADGTVLNAATMQDEALTSILAGRYEKACVALPSLPRGVSGYDVQRSYDPQTGRMDWRRLIAGSEGSLVLLQNIKLRVIAKPQHRAMVILAYDDFDTALRHVRDILDFNPVAIETIDDRILDLARGDILWSQLRTILPSLGDAIRAMHFVEFEAFARGDLQKEVDAFSAFIATDKTISFSQYTDAPSDIAAILGLRKKCVGLLGNMEGNRRPIPFIEDTAVPPETLADYIRDLRAFLASHNLVCGVFGHSDAGCLHVRPALDMRVPEDEALIRTLTDGVVSLLKKHGGVLWGEHGKGMRSEYTASLVGGAYYETMQAIKAHLDPHNRLNPGKIASTGSLRPIDQAPLRGHYDRQIDKGMVQGFPKAVECNGNGLCFSSMPDDTMCPSYKVTRDRRHSPKGRAGLLREWMRLASVDKKAADAFAPQVHDALRGCLSCKACTSSCPIHVNVPQMKSDFLNVYYARKIRPVRDWAIGLSERLLPCMRFMPSALGAWLGLRDIEAPRAIDWERAGVRMASADTIAASRQPVIVVIDAYARHYDAKIIVAAFELSKKLGFDPLAAPIRESGKAWHVYGFKNRFKRVAKRNHEYLAELAKHGAPMVGIDPSLTLMYRDEYRAVQNGAPPYTILLLQEWLSLRDLPKATEPKAYDLHLHCTEKTMLPDSARLWRDIFTRSGLALNIVETGCCGMAGAYGHEAEHVENSKALYAMSWREKVHAQSLATGFSCRSQAKRVDGLALRHPIEALNEAL